MSYRNNKKRRKINLSYFRKCPPVDKTLLLIIIFLCIFGLIAVFSAGIAEGVEHYSNPLYYPIKQLTLAIPGFIIMFFLSYIPFSNWKKWTMFISLVTAALIIATLIPGLGKTDYGSSRWLTFLPVQPSEFGKLACILLAASGLCNAKTLLDKKLLKNCMVILVIMIVILKQPNMSLFLLLSITGFAMFLMAGLNLWLPFFIGCAFVPFVAYRILSTPYQAKRIMGWLDPFSDPQGLGYNIIQSWYAISSGGLFGCGIGNSKQKLYYLPFGYTDFIFAVISEELGFIGSVALIILFLLFIKQGFKICSLCDDKFGKLLGFGIVFIIAAQAFINMCVAIGVFPVTGVTLPLISYGGSSFIATTAMLGILLNISRYNNKRLQELKDKGNNENEKFAKI